MASWLRSYSSGVRCVRRCIVRKHNGEDRRVHAEGVATCFSRNERARSACGMVALGGMLLFAAIS